jgi:predicted Rossmann fold flavoprotein
MSDTWDVIVIGGGAAGMMSAGVAAAQGERVLLLEKNSILGKKLRITGGGRCNITNHTLDTHTLLKKYGEAEPFLYSTFSTYGVSETLAFFHKLGLLTKVEAENRVFPQSESAENVAETLVSFLHTNHVTIKTNITVKKILTEGDHITGIRTNDGVYTAKRYIIATGGTSRPETGSTGDGYSWLSELGCSIIRPTPSLVPVKVKEQWIATLAGISLNDTTISLFQNSTLFSKTKGKVLFTHEGLSGPGILNLSQLIGEALTQDPVEVRINTVPQMTEEELLSFLRNLPVSEPNRKLPERLVEPILKTCHLDGERLVNTVTRTERHRLTLIIRALPLSIKSLLGTDKAIIASGGLALTEIDFKTMRTKKHQNLHVVGDLLNINRPSGGYSLQLCWTTGYVAGISRQ